MSERSTGRGPERRATHGRRRVLRAAATVAGAAVAGCLVDLESGAVGGDGGDRTGGNRAAGDGGTVATPSERVAAAERATHERVNDVRSRHDVGQLAYNEAIAAVARRHSEDMAERGYVGHESPEGEGPADRLAEFVPGHCRSVGENIASVPVPPGGDPSALAERVVSGWLDSPGHRENLLREAYDEEGVGVAYADGRALVTQNFCGTGGLDR